MHQLNSILDFVKAAALTTVSQLIAVIGIFFLFGTILYFLARFTRNTFVQSVGYKADIVWTGWLGTPVHELGHTLFCILFMHSIVEMKLYDPEAPGGTMGYVNHVYDTRSTYQKIGNFFIGAGPIILGAVALYAAMYYLVPNKRAVFDVITAKKLTLGSLSHLKAQALIMWDTGRTTLDLLFSTSNLRTWQFWVFLYISVCVASHMELSPPDLKGMWSGLASLIILLFIINCGALLFGFDLQQYVMIAHGYTGMFVGLFIYATIISAMNFTFSYLVLTPYTLINRKSFINPFT